MEENKYFRTHNMNGFREKTDYDYIVRSTCLRSRVQLRAGRGEDLMDAPRPVLNFEKPRGAKRNPAI